MPLLSFANTLEITGDTARIQTSAEVGYRVVEAPLPALVSVTKAINEPRYPSMKGIMQSKKKPIDTWSLADLGLEAGQVGASASGEKVESAERVATARKGETVRRQRGRGGPHRRVPRRAEGVVGAFCERPAEGIHGKRRLGASRDQ